MRQYITTLTIWASLLLAELHTFWENSTKEANWIWTKNVQMPVQWNIKYVTDEVWFILMALAILFYIPNRINKTTVKAYLIFCVLDLVFYFYNYKQEGYEWMYIILLVSWVWIYNSSETKKEVMAW